ncbi:hypothetical protein [Flagellimonas flava]|uniref:hypothetical protein n=1 Tax=Flagellimonas flava TaxID=570519 RepID=UPI003D65FFA8
MSRKVEDIESDLEKAKEKFLDVMRRGDEAISEYDLSMGYDADFYLNRVPLLRNHIIFYRRELKEATKHGIQASLFDR